MLGIQIIGLLLGFVMLFYGWYRSARGNFRRIDRYICYVLSFSLLLVSVYPPIQNILKSLFNLENRLFATLIFSNFVLFSLFFYLLARMNNAQQNFGRLVRAMARKDFQAAHRRHEGERSVAVVIPAYNEQHTIVGILRRLPKEIAGHRLIPVVIVDGAVDQTELVVKEADHAVTSHVINRGQGDALRTGFDIALHDIGADIVVTMDADGQHLPEEIELLIRPIVEDRADYVMGSRFLGQYQSNSVGRRIGIVVFTKLINFLGNVKITDCTNGFRAIRGESLLRLDLKEDRFNAPELIMDAANKGLRILEVPVTIALREEGESKKPKGIGYPLGFGATILRTWLR